MVDIVTWHYVRRRIRILDSFHAFEWCVESHKYAGAVFVRDYEGRLLQIPQAHIYETCEIE